jgi:tRNA A-37 threonylcarbamoyl transferase component Bud32
MPAACPDENTLVGFMGGQLDTGARADIEAHVDGCSTCAAVMATLGRARSLRPTHDDQEPTGEPQRGRWGNRYEVLACLGRGAMGTVYAARDLLLERQVALKVLHPRQANDAAPQRLWREARALAQISHPNVVAVYDAGEDGGTLFLTMEQVRGQSLAEWLRSTPRSCRDILDAFRQAGAGLAAAHGAGVLHRDFKPDNVLVGDDGVVRVTDFGLARPLLEEAIRNGVADQGSAPWRDAMLTASGTVLGTPAYMAPEQVAGREVGHAADQFSFCVALREALQGARDRSSVPAWVAPMVARGLALDPAHRHPAMAAVVGELDGNLHPRTSVQLRVNALLQLLAFAVHVMLVAVFAKYIATHEASPAAATSDGATPSANPVTLAIVALYVFVWLPIGMVWTPINAYGLYRNRRWASVSTMIYSLTALPTCIGTPFGAYALATLWRYARGEKK